MRCTRCFRAPRYPYVGLRLPVTDGSGLTMSTSSRQSTPLEPLTGFEDETYPVTNLPLPTVYGYMQDLTVIMDEFSSGSLRCNSSLLRHDQMMFVQHNLVSLPSRQWIAQSQTDVETTPVVLAVYEVSRLALRCYAYLVTFPTPATIFPREHLTRALYEEIRNLLSFSPRLSQLRLAFWAAVMGAVVAYGICGVRKQYIDVVAELANKLRLTGWSEAKSLMDSYLWHSQTNDVDALNLWVEVQTRVSR